VPAAASRAREDRLAFGRKRVFGLADDIGEIEVETRLERRIGGDEAVDLGLADRQDFGANHAVASPNAV
jgi:hypothetical protein